MYCSNCGKELSDDAKFCCNCGNNVGVQKKVVSLSELTSNVLEKANEAKERVNVEKLTGKVSEYKEGISIKYFEEKIIHLKDIIIGLKVNKKTIGILIGILFILILAFNMVGNGLGDSGAAKKVASDYLKAINTNDEDLLLKCYVGPYGYEIWDEYMIYDMMSLDDMLDYEYGDNWYKRAELKVVNETEMYNKVIYHRTIDRDLTLQKSISLKLLIDGNAEKTILVDKYEDLGWWVSEIIKP